MPRKPVRPWFRKSNRQWYVCIGGRQVSLGANKADANKRFHELMAKPKAVVVPSVFDQADPCVSVLIDRFLDWSEREQATATYDWYRWRLEPFTEWLNKNKLIHLGSTKLIPAHITEWLSSRPDWSPGYRHGCIRAVQRVFNFSIKEGLLAANPLAKMPKPEPGRREFIFTSEQIETLLASTDDRFRRLLIALSLSGARPWEVRHVTASNMTPDGKCWYWPIGKKGKPRIVYLPEAVQEICRELAAKHQTGPLFRNSRGVGWTKNAVFFRMRNLRAKLGLPAGAVAYALRHTFATERLRAGEDLLTVAKLMGHESVDMVARIYAHLPDSHLQAAAERVK